MSEKVELKEKLERPAQLSASEGRIESYSTLAGAMKGWRRLSPEDKATAVIWCDGEVYEREEIEQADAAA